MKLVVPNYETFFSQLTIVSLCVYICKNSRLHISCFIGRKRNFTSICFGMVCLIFILQIVFFVKMMVESFIYIIFVAVKGKNRFKQNEYIV